MSKFIFFISVFCTIIVLLFSFTKVSVNGYKADYYFSFATILLNIFAFQIQKNSFKAYISISLAFLLFLGTCFAILTFGFRVDKIYNHGDAKYNLYSRITFWYRKTYFKRYKSPKLSCNDGELWQTKVPIFFPFIEIEIKRNECYKMNSENNYVQE